MSARRKTRRASIVITAGPTREKIDPVRFISNYSTGTFGYEIAKEAARRGCRVTLVSGPTALENPPKVKTVRVESAREMKAAVEKAVKGADCLIMAAAVSDWRAARPSAKKLKRGSGRVTLELVENPDILAGIAARKIDGLRRRRAYPSGLTGGLRRRRAYPSGLTGGLRRRRAYGGGLIRGLKLVGFALETEGVEKNALKKLRKKGLDMIIANEVGKKSSPFGDHSTNIAIMDRRGMKMKLSGATKRQAAKIILDKAFDSNI